MKKTLALILATLTMATMTACSSAPSKPESNDDSASKPEVSTPEASQGKLELKEEDGVLKCLDTTNSPFEDSGLNITVDGETQTVNFVKTDSAGKDTVEYWKFNYTDNTVEKYTYVSMMGTGFYYYYDLSAQELVRVESDNHEDKTDSTKENGRFDSAAEDTKDQVNKLEAYFSEQFGKSIKEAATE